MRWLRIVLFFLFFAGAHESFARKQVSLAQWGLDTVISKQQMNGIVYRAIDSFTRNHILLDRKVKQSVISHPVTMVDNSTDFYLILALVILLGFIRLSNPRYFYSLVRSFYNPVLNSRQLKEQIQLSKLSNLLMNLFFTLSVGAYLFYLSRLYTPDFRSPELPAAVFILLLILGVGLIYVIKYFVIRLTGWAFKVEGLTEQYLYNVFLINKIISIALLPFVVFLAFGEAKWLGPTVICSGLVIGILMLSRYIRSWQVFGSFFQYSKFHFFIYLCASELLPLAVLTKLVVHGIV